MVTGELLVVAARKYLGVPYVFGGTTARGLDCSGLIWRALEDLGARGTFPRVSSAQIDATTPISVTEALNTPGALVWFPGHDALTIGDGKSTIEAVVNPGDRVAIFKAPKRWKRAGLIPGINYGKSEPVSKPGPVMVGRFTSGYNPKRYITYQGRRVFSPHLGIDVAPPVPGTAGTPVYAVFAGKVEGVVHGRKAGQSANVGRVVWRGYSGNGGRVRNPDGEKQIYIHVNFRIRNGTRVKVGDLLGYTDRSGVQTGPHVHLTFLNRGGREYDPMIVFNRHGVKPNSTPTKPKPPKKKDWFDMATEKQLRDIVRVEVRRLLNDRVKLTGPASRAFGGKSDTNVGTLLRYAGTSRGEGIEQHGDLAARLDRIEKLLRDKE